MGPGEGFSKLNKSGLVRLFDKFTLAQEVEWEATAAPADAEDCRSLAKPTRRKIIHRNKSRKASASLPGDLLCP